MKKFFFLLALLLPMLGQSQPMSFSAVNHPIVAVSQPTANKVAVVGTTNILLTSDNLGASWTGRKTPTGGGYTDVSMASANVGWAVGSAGFVVKTTDGGQTWTQQISGVTATIDAVFALNETTAFISGGGGSGIANASFILKTTDGGVTWNPMLPAATPGISGAGASGTVYYSSVKGLYFISPTVGWAAGGLSSATLANGSGGKIFKTTDGGTTWNITTISSTNFSFRSIWFGTDSIGYACGNPMNSTAPNNFYKTTDAGTTWTLTNSYNLILQKVRAFGTNSLFIATGAGTNAIIRKSSDGGTSWSNDTLSTTTGTLSGLSVRDSIVFATGSVGTIYRYNTNGGSWTQVNGGTAFNVNEMFFADANTGWTANPGGRVAKTTNNGGSWTFYTTSTSNELISLHFTDANTGYAVGLSGAGTKTTNGGLNWSAMSFPSGTQSQYDVFFASANKGWACGGSGTINHTNDAGTTWTAQTTGITNVLNSVYFIDTLTGWSVGLSGRILKTTDGGTTWALQSLPAAATTTLYDVWFADANNGYCAGASGKAYKTINGGATWTEMTTGTTFFINDMEWLDVNRGFLGCSGGVILYTHNGGTTWQPAAPYLTTALMQNVTKVPGSSPTQIFFGYINPIGGAFTIVKSSMQTVYPDGDGDGYGNGSATEAFVVTAGYAANNTDCDDANNAVNPGATEICNFIDDDCDTAIDEGTISTFYADADGDNYGNADISQMGCTAPSGYTTNDDDCNDADAAINPGQAEVCYNTTDENCDGQVNEGCAPLGISFTITASCVSSSANSITIGALGGVAPFQYSKNGGATYQTSPTFNNLAPGSYSLAVKDAANNVATQTAVVAPLMTLTTSIVPPLCNAGSDGQVSVAVAGGYAAYSYAWTKAGVPIGGNTATLTGMSTGSYKVVVTDDKGCTKAANRMLTQPSAISVSGTRTNVSCNGGSNGTINLTASGGTGSKTYLWNDGATSEDRTGIAAGAYTCTVTDANGCTKVSATFTITQPTAINIAISKTNVSCFGGSNGKAKATGSGGSGLKTYLWSTGATVQEILNLSAGAYTVTVTDAAGCTKTSVATITEPTEVLITNVVSTPVGSNFSVTVTASGGTPPLKYKRSLTGGGYSSENGTGIFNNVPAGAYEFIARDAKFCADTVIVPIGITIQPSSVGDRTASLGAMRISPNPATDALNIQFTDGAATGRVIILDAIGRIAIEQNIALTQGENGLIRLDRFSAGTYTLKFLTSDGTALAVQKFIVVK